MQKFTRISLILFLTCLCTYFSFGQSDSTKTQVLDVIYLKDGRILKGDILSFDESTGGIVFKDLFDRNYSFGRADYDYFKENVVFEKKVKKPKVIHERKADAFGFAVGIHASQFILNEKLTEDDYYFSTDAYLGLSTNLKLSAGRHFGTQHFAGLFTDFSLTSGDYSHYSIGARYTYHYQAEGKNTAFYLPVELHYQQVKFDQKYQVRDTNFFVGGYTYPKEIDTKTSLSSLQLTIGQGVSFFMRNKKAISLELALSKSFGMKHQFSGLTVKEPTTEFSSLALRFGILYQF